MSSTADFPSEPTGTAVSFVIPAHDEERLLPRTLASIRAAAERVLEPQGLVWEIVVCDDASRDGTVAVALGAGARVVSIERRQISAARNAGAAASRGALLVFVDADTILGAPVLRAALAAVTGGAVGGGARTRLDGRLPLHARALVAAVSWAMVALRLAAGCFLFCKREDFAAVGGFDETIFVSEEIALSRALKRRGRFVVLSEPVLSSGRKLRTHPLREHFAVLWRAVRGGRKVLRSRQGLDLWYGERRNEPPAGS